jgi:hypothetical protein
MLGQRRVIRFDWITRHSQWVGGVRTNRLGIDQITEILTGQGITVHAFNVSFYQVSAAMFVFDVIGQFSRHKNCRYL